ncbi:MAG: hypothetical protein JJE21_07775 [Spirochaetaceae bacterium]|nr:hypothetical protein [Spirochaetaceae bacterium]
MSKPKKLNLPISELTKIALSINKNTIDNRTRNKEKKITTDTFIRQFEIQRKDFSETIKDTNIEYNKSTFQYTFDGLNNSSDTKITPTEKTHRSRSDTIGTPANKIHNNYSDTKVASTNKTESETIETNVSIVEFENMKSGLVEMLEWYRRQRKNENIIDIEIPKININREKLTEQAVTRGFKIYPVVVTEFKKFCNHNSQYTMQDLMAMALLEYCDKYK